jgi:hypothetical protein
MSILLQLIELIQRIKTLTQHSKSQKDLDDAYLSDSADVYDLERRMREIDLRSRSASRGLAYAKNLL